MTTTTSSSKPKGTKIAMTVPVVMHGEGGQGRAANERKMQFLLPAEYDQLSDIPKLTDPRVRVTRIPPAVGAVHTYRGFLDRSKSREMASKLTAQLQEDGTFVDLLDPQVVLERFQYWRFHPPMTPPFLRRNEVWIELTHEQEVEGPEKKFQHSAAHCVHE